MIQIVFFIMWCFSLLLGILLPDGIIALILSVITLLYVGRFVAERSSLHMMFFVGYCTFLFLPAVLNWYYLGISFELYFLSSLAATFFLYLTRKTLVRGFIDHGTAPRFLFFFFCLLILTLVFAGMGGLSTALFAFLIMLMSMSFKDSNLKNNIFVFICFFIVFCAYALFSWSGFGRTVTVGWLLLACLQFTYSLNFRINKFIFGLVPGVAAMFMSNRNFFDLKFTGFENVLSDSAYGPYRLASTFTSHFKEHGYDISGFIDQIIFTFFVFVPRTVWPEKPYGFGFEYTVRHLDAYLVDAGHSIASTLIGDHLYFLGYLGLVTSIIVMAVIAYAANLLYKIKGLNGHGVLLFSANMMVLAWGGMTSFSARVALPSIIFVVFFLLFRRILTRKVKFVWGA